MPFLCSPCVASASCVPVHRHEAGVAVRLASALLIASIAVNAVGAQADAWPTRPIRVVTPFPAGSTVDAVLRTMQPQLAERLGQSLVIDNRSGASGAIGVEV